MRNRLLVIAVISLFLSSTVNAQFIGGDVLLQGRWLEIGICPMGALGTQNGLASPGYSGYHPHLPSGYLSPGFAANLAEVYDYGHDGWSVGAPQCMGDYTYPGSPFEGWELQVNGRRLQAYYNNWPYGVTWTYSGAGTVTGGLMTTYSNTGGDKRATQTGTYNGIQFVQETRVDSQADAVVMTTKFYNTTSAAIPGVYFWRSCDPDNDETWPSYGGMFPTNNYINFQTTTIPNPTHKVSVTGIGQSTTLPPLTLCTKDCRAVATIYSSWGLTVSQDLATVWNQTYGGGGGAYYNVGVNHPGDIGIGLAFNIGTIQPGDSAVISYAYVFNGPGGIDDAGALPDPKLVVNGSVVNAFPDTFDMCTLPPGIDTAPVSILYGADKTWTNSKWTWTPATALSATTGVSVTVHGTMLPGPVTYTVTGTDSATCNSQTFIFTINPCQATPDFTAILRRGCVNDTVDFYNVSFNATHWAWRFPDGTVDSGYYADSTHWNTTHIFQGHATPDVTLMAGNFRGDFTKVRTLDLRHDIHAGFAAQPDTICFEPGVAMHFMNTATADTGDFYGGLMSGSTNLVPYLPGRYSWNFRDTGLSTLSDPDYPFSRPAMFKVKQIVWDAISCPDTIEHPVFVVQNTIRMVDDTSFCYAILTPLYNVVTTVPFTPDANAYSYSWVETPTPHLDNPSGQLPRVTTTGFFKDYFTVTIPGIGPDGCPAYDSINISSYLPKKIQNISASVTIPYGNSVQLNANNMVLYYWTPNDGSLDNPNISNPIATPAHTTTYMVHGLDNHSCPDSTVVTVIVDTTMVQQIPTAFTPNGDGINDVFRPVGIQFQHLLEFRVFNRWGQEIFYTNNREVGWDGTYHGDKQDAGVYSYLIVVARPGQDNVVYKGNITLLR